MYRPAFDYAKTLLSKMHDVNRMEPFRDVGLLKKSEHIDVRRCSPLLYQRWWAIIPWRIRYFLQRCFDHEEAAQSVNTVSGENGGRAGVVDSH